ncbi:MAG: hypothetical protein ACOH2N_09265 [Devosia sp.]
MSVQVLLPDERAEQLKRFAISQNVPMAEAVGLLLNDAIVAGKIRDELPGFTIEKNGEHVTLDTGAWKHTLTRELARGYAAQIRAITRPAFTPGPDNPFFPELQVSVIRRGVGVKLFDREAHLAKVVSPGVADDVARRLDRAAE